jgi:lipoyl-dependent peroxiredoxin
MFREAHASWKGGPYAGEGAVSTPSGVLANANYAFGKLAEVPPCTTPCELLAAAIASCMSVMVALEMLKLGMRPVSVDTYAVLTLNNPADKWQITGAHLKVTTRTVEGDRKRLEQAVEAARRECPVSNALKLNLTCTTELISLTPSAAA